MSLYQRVAYIRPDHIEELPGQNLTVQPWVSDLFMPARNFRYNTYSCPGDFAAIEQGLLAIVAYDGSPPWGGGPYCSAGYSIITKADGTMDVMPFMEAMAAITTLGVTDEALSHAQRKDKARYRAIEMRCGHTTDFVRSCASQVSVITRKVHMLNVTAQNGFDDGHVACEAMLDGKWRLFDVPNDCAWADSEGELLSLAEVTETRPINSARVRLAQSRVGFTPTGANGWVSALHHMSHMTEDMSTAWCERIYDVPGMATATGIVWGVPAHLSSYAASIANYPGSSGWTTLPLDQWIAAYY